MAHLLQPRYTKKGRTHRCRIWYGVWRDSKGTRHRRPLSPDKTAARALLTDTVRQRERELAGLLATPANKTLEECLADWEASLRTRATPRYVAMQTGRCRKLLVAAGCRNLLVEPLAVEQALAGLRADGKSIQTVNFYLAAPRCFVRWCVRHGRLPLDSLVTLQPGNVRTDRRHDRRAMTSDEFQHLLQTTVGSTQTVEGFDGLTRAVLYAVAGSTGLRASELRSLSVTSFNLDEATVRCRAAYTKNGQEAIQPLPATLVAHLRAFLDGRPADERPWEKLSPTHTARMLRHDLAVAGIPYKTESGYCDFHSLRTYYVTSLMRAGVHPRIAQVLARHSTIHLTMAVYTRPGDEVVAAVAHLTLPQLACVPACTPPR